MPRAFLLFLFFMPFVLKAQLRLPALISSGMVLQQNDSCTIWGWASPGEKIYVTSSWNQQTDSTLVDPMAKFSLKIKTPSAGGPHTLRIRNNRESIRLDSVYIGEVWVCSGQSNMEWSYMHGLEDVKAELPTAYNPAIRFFHIPKTASLHPQDDVKAGWKICDSVNLKTFSAVGYFFGKKLHRELKVPVGLIHASWGGTPAEVWTPAAIVNEEEDLRAAQQKLQPRPWWPNEAGSAYNAMIHPLTPFNIAGVIWYQGESNTTTSQWYYKLFTSMINAWRNAWNKNLPFYYAQIAPYNYGAHNIGALLQEAQLKALHHPGTGMVVTADLVDNINDIHPVNKHDVGYRLADWALGETYQRKGFVYKLPILRSSSRSKNRIYLRFSNAGKGFAANPEPLGFYISGEKEEWLPARVRINRDHIIVWHEKIREPKHVRYAFGNTIIGNIYTRDGIPLPAFRTDSWPPDQSPVKK